MNKYKRAISGINASNEFKSSLIEEMNIRQKEINMKQNANYEKKYKLTKIIASITSILGLLLGGGLAYAGITGNLKFGESDIEFSQKMEEYKETVENQTLESNGNIIKLTSKLCDDGFVVLQFDVTLSEEQSKHAEETVGLQYVSFNDEIVNEYGFEETRLAGANYNVIIDGEKYWLRGATDSQIVTNIENKSYTFYQLWFLSDSEIGSKEEFTITLKDVRMMVGERLISFDGKFDVQLSKTKAINNTTTYKIENVAISYERLRSNVEKIIKTPMQTLIKLRNTLNNVTYKNFSYLGEDDYIGYLKYQVYDQDGNELSEYDLITKFVYYYNDGTIKESNNEEGIEYDGFYKYDVEEYVVIAQNDSVTKLTVEIFEVNEYKGITRNIGECHINLINGKTETKNTNIITERDENAPIYFKVDRISPSEIKEFSIDIKNSDYEIIRTFEKINTEGFSVESDDENANKVMYDIDLKGIEVFFQLILFRDKSVYNYYNEYIEGDVDFSLIKIKENDDYILAVNALSESNYNAIKDIINTIEWK